MKTVTKLFFITCLQERLSKDKVDTLEDSDNRLGNISFMDLSKGSARKQDKKLNESDHCGQKRLPLEQWKASFPSNKSQDVELQASGQINDDALKFQEVVDLYSPQNDSR